MPTTVLRLKRRRQFLRVAGARRKWATPGLILQMRQRAATEEPAVGDANRIGFTVSRRVGGAVVRNRIRRRLRAAAAVVLPVRAAEGCDFVIIGRAEALRRPFPALVEDLQQALDHLDADPGEEAAAGVKRTEGQRTEGKGRS